MLTKYQNLSLELYSLNVLEMYDKETNCINNFIELFNTLEWQINCFDEKHINLNIFVWDSTPQKWYYWNYIYNPIRNVKSALSKQRFSNKNIYIKYKTIEDLLIPKTYESTN